MSNGKKWLYIAGGGIAALALLSAGAFVFVESGLASTGVSNTLPALQSTAGMKRITSRGIAFGFPGDEHSPFGNHQEALAEALGISVEALEAAQEEARNMAIEQAVKDGLITQEQADEILSRDREGGGRPRPMMGFGEQSSYLADALGISLTELADAQEQARETVLAQAIEDGKLTQDQADLLRAGSAIRDYIAEAIGGAFDEALQNAVADGVITQAQADQLSEMNGPGFHGFRGRGSFGHRVEKDQ